MKLAHLGDGLDHWKGALFELLQTVLRDLHVVPMLTDLHERSWSDDHFALYAKLLRLSIFQPERNPVDRILMKGTRFPTKPRLEYFQGAIKEIDRKGDVDLFVDPDNGIEPRRSCEKEHVAIDEVQSLLPLGSSRLLLVYQHFYREPEYVRASLKRLTGAPSLAGSHAFGYWGGAVSMICITQDEVRFITARDQLTSWLGSIAHRDEKRNLAPRMIEV